MDNDDQRAVLNRLARRVDELEAREQIARLISGYGPAVDSGAAATTAELWTDTGSYSYSFGTGVEELEGREELTAMVDGRHHQAIIAGGAGHVLTAPLIRLEGDHAIATNHSLLVRHDPDTGHYYVDRLSANRWTLRRTGESWRVEGRDNRLLDGRAEARHLLDT